jgi:uncharacterized protein (DUF1778 family)
MKNRQKKTLDTPGLFREHTLTFRVTFDQLDTLKRTARNNGTTVSDVIRQALPVDGK